MPPVPSSSMRCAAKSVIATSTPVRSSASSASVMPSSGQVDGGRLGHGVGARGHHEQAAPGAAAHACDVVVLQQPDRFSQQGPAHPFAVDQLGLGPDQIARLEVLGHHGLGDVARHRLGTLALGRLRQHDRVGEQLAGGAAAAEELRLRFEMLPHAIAGQAGIARHDGLGDLGVGVLRLTAEGLPEVLPVRRVELGHPVEDVDEQLEPGIAADLGHQHVQPTGIAPRLHRALPPRSAGAPPGRPRRSARPPAGRRAPPE